MAYFIGHPDSNDDGK